MWENLLDLNVIEPMWLSRREEKNQDDDDDDNYDEEEEDKSRELLFSEGPLIKSQVRELKMSLRDPRRPLLWRRIFDKLEGKHDVNAKIYEETMSTLYPHESARSSPPSLLPCTDPKLMKTYGLNEDGAVSVRRIIHCIAYNAPDIQYCSLVFPLLSILRHFFKENECYISLMTLLRFNDKVYMPQSQRQEEINHIALLELTLKFSNKKARALLTKGKTNDEMKAIFEHCNQWIFNHLPFTHIIRIMDCYLLEGEKILFRICIVLFHSFAKGLESSEYIKSFDVLNAFETYVRNIKISPTVLMNKAFNLRGFSQNDIDKSKRHAETQIRSQIFTSAKTRQTDLVTKLCETEKFLKPHLSLKNVLNLPKLPKEATILNVEMISFLWKFLPPRVVLCSNLELAFSSDIHGTSITTFYQKIETYEQTFVIIRSKKQEVFGSYCSMSWRVRNMKDNFGNHQKYFGTGESFLFKLKPELEYFPWAGPGDGVNKIEDHSRDLFMSGTQAYIYIGGGHGIGLLIDGTLTFGSSEKCLTFNNKPLSSTQNFQISLIEVYGLS